MKKAYLAGGCFWCVEHDLRELEGVTSVISGYATHTTDIYSTPTYENHKGFRETVCVEYDDAIVSFTKIIQYFLEHIDPTDSGGQFADRGDSYKSTIYYQNTDEEHIAHELITELDQSGVYDKSVVVEVLPFAQFTIAEEYHQNYAQKNAIHYGLYRKGSGREDFINKTCALREEKNIIWKQRE